MLGNRPTPDPIASPAPGARLYAAHRSAPWPTGISSEVLQSAARRVAARAREDIGHPAEAEEVAELLVLLAIGVDAQQRDADAPVHPRLCSPLGRRLLELLRTEVARYSSEKGGALIALPAIRTSMERMRVAMERNGAQDFASHLSGPVGLKVLVDIAHDLRSPLTSILFLAETLQRGQSGPVTDLQRRQLGLIYSAALGLSSMASDIIELARGGDQLVDDEPVPFSVQAIFESVRDIVQPLAEEKQLAVRLLPPATDARLGHPVALSRVLLNLTTNALKFTDHGSVEIAAREIGPTRAEFSVRDSGRGIDPAIMETLYKPVRQTGEGSGRIFSQTGLGLAMCRRLVEALGSELKVESRADWGTRFFFELDVSPLRPRPS
jgi:signal transduction histidine kinase